MSSTNLPQELVDVIVHNLCEDISSLRSCSLAARAFVVSAQIHIFKRIEIMPPTDPSSSSNSCQKLYKLLTLSPHLAQLVDELRIVLVGPETSFEYDSDGQYLEDRHVTWIMRERRTLALVLPLLDLKRISLVEDSPLDWNSYGEFSMKWNELGRHLKAALSKAFSSPRLESVQLRGIVLESPRQLLALFSDATALTELSLSRVYYTQRWDQRDPWPESQPWHPRLQSLLASDISGDPICRQLISPRIDLTCITSLTIATEANDSRETIIRAANSTVEHLKLRYISGKVLRSLKEFCSNLPSGAGDFKSIIGPNLRSLHLLTTTFHSMDALFKSCPHDARLESVVFEGPLSGTCAPSVNATVDAALVHFRFLKKVEVRRYLFYDSEPFSTWSAEILASLPSLVQRSILAPTEVSVEDKVHHGWE
ncbi:hypothetical protein DFH08DRAFT_807297 [Mycena albidolilacea]|uniref:Uncharacterized protein n=1 Tax=Mycena albidolilacea TaxID=1033008 RepID=A0AAD7A5N2_9AGAR|nr:hypothetical protein DFH08DRAFT_807297 [Mycena albidolilacea]